MAQRTRFGGLVTGAVALVVVATACAGSSAPGSGGAQSTAAPSTGAASSGAAPSVGIVNGVELVEYAAATDPVAGAKRELALAREIRDDAGMPALIGAKGVAAFDTLDAIEAGFGRSVLEAANASIASRDPRVATSDPLAGQLASIRDTSGSRRSAPDAIDISLFADTGFTASAIMSLYVGLVERAAQSQTGTIPKQEHFEQTADGLRQVVDLSTTMTVATGGGRVSADITMSATDRIFDAASGSFVALYTSTASGHFDVNACPNENGVGAGTYTFETKHELNDVAGATSARSGAGRSVESPFTLYNGDDAHLLRIEANLALAADAHGPGSASGPGPTGPFDWGASQHLRVVMPASGGTTGSGAGAAVTGSGGERAGGALFLSSAMAQLFISQVGKAAEEFWRSGKCIDLKPSRDSGKVQPKEQIELTVDAKHKFPPSDVKAPIVATFSGKASLEPTNSPVDPPARFTFKAGEQPGDRGTINLKQTSKRGIATKTIDFEVEPAVLWITMTGRLTQPGANLSMTVPESKLESSGQQYQGVVTAGISGTVEALGCSHPVSDQLALRVLATVDEADPTLVRLFVLEAAPSMGKEEEITCQGATTRAPIPSYEFAMPFLGGDGTVGVTVDQPSTFTDSGFGEVRVTVTVRREQTPP